MEVEVRELGRPLAEAPQQVLPAVALLSRAPACLGRKLAVALLAAPALFGLLLLAVLLDAASRVGVRALVLCGRRRGKREGHLNSYLG